VHTARVTSRGRDIGGRIAFTEVYVRTGGLWRIAWSELQRQ
jgi:hypothetical protein